MSEPTEQETGAAYIFGEVLLDEFPDGKSVVGGAPFNVAWNLHGLGMCVEFLSAIGIDAAGQRVERQMTEWGMSTRGLRRIDSAPTGRVTIELHDGQPSYNIEKPCAYDCIRFPEPISDFPPPTLLYHGTLALRERVSRDALERLIDHCDCPRFVDLNLREPWFEMELAESLLPGAQWVKLNDEELGLLAGTPPPRVADDVQAAVHRVRRRFGGETYLVTCGARGAYVVEHDGLKFAASPRVKSLQDTVGAGDAFSAAFIHSLAQQASLPDTLTAATQFAAKVCGMRGATTTDRDFYRAGSG